jgi:hypothetical protein
MQFDQTDYSVVMKNSTVLPKAWKWEIHRAGRGTPIDHSSVCFHSFVTASRAGKEALKHFVDGHARLSKRPSMADSDSISIGRWDDDGGR